MDVIFEPENGTPFTMIVDFFDTIEEIKLKIQQLYAIPASDQTFTLNGRVLPNNGDVASCEIFQNTRITITLPVKKVTLRVNIPIPTPHIIPIQMPENDTVLNLKDKILESEQSLRGSVNLSVLVLQSKGQELQENRRLSECDVSGEDTVIEVSLRWRAANNLMVTLRSRCGTRRIPVWVKATDEVKTLRPLLWRLSQKFGFPLPPKYYFSHMQLHDVLEDDLSFQWQDVARGDTIEVIPGRGC